MSNPRVRGHLVFYPEDAGKHLSEVYQAQHWLRDMDPTLLTPMVRVHGRDFFIFEPTLLTDGTACMPTRWFTRKGSDHFFAESWPLIAHMITNQPGWVVMEHAAFVLSSEHLLHNFTSFCASHTTYNIPHPASIHGAHTSIILLYWCLLRLTLGVQRIVGGPLHAWSLTDPVVGNRWRKLADGQRVLAFPLWCYCDDTSGNVSKKWNKHNSFLFSPAGLPRSQVHKEYNIHFLCTSNIAPPLEMLDAVVNQLKYVINLLHYVSHV